MSEKKDIKGCLAGKILWIDLSTTKIWTENTEEYFLKTLGGRGINSLIMLEKIDTNTQWDDLDNLLCFAAGSLVGTMAPGACRVDISTINFLMEGKVQQMLGGFGEQN